MNGDTGSSPLDSVEFGSSLVDCKSPVLLLVDNFPSFSRLAKC